MAELKGPILFSGSIGNIRAYYNKVLKRWVVSTKGGTNKEIINNNPTLVRQRENMKEFKACALWSSQLRKSLISISYLFQGYYFSEIMKMAKIIQKHDDVNKKGIRSIASSKDASLLTNIGFNRLHPFDQVFSHQYELEFSEDRKTVTLMLRDFKSYIRINWPARYEAYRIALVIAQLPDLEWVERDNCYQPVAQHLERLTKTVFSEWRQSSTLPEDIVLTVSFAQPALQTPGTTVVVGLGVEISMAISNTNSENLSGFGTMKIIQCFV